MGSPSLELVSATLTIASLWVYLLHRSLRLPPRAVAVARAPRHTCNAAQMALLPLPFCPVMKFTRGPWMKGIKKLLAMASTPYQINARVSMVHKVFHLNIQQLAGLSRAGFQDLSKPIDCFITIRCSAVAFIRIQLRIPPL